jgi:hypothetical protein
MLVRHWRQRNAASLAPRRRFLGRWPETARFSCHSDHSRASLRQSSRHSGSPSPGRSPPIVLRPLFSLSTLRRRAETDSMSGQFVQVQQILLSARRKFVAFQVLEGNGGNAHVIFFNHHAPQPTVLEFHARDLIEHFECEAGASPCVSLHRPHGEMQPESQNREGRGEPFADCPDRRRSKHPCRPCFLHNRRRSRRIRRSAETVHYVLRVISRTL